MIKRIDSPIACPECDADVCVVFDGIAVHCSRNHWDRERSCEWSDDETQLRRVTDMIDAILYGREARIDWTRVDRLRGAGR